MPHFPQPQPSSPAATTPSSAHLISQARTLLITARDGTDADVTRAIESLSLLVSAIRLESGDQAAWDFLNHSRALFAAEGTNRERAQVLELLVTDTSSLLSMSSRESILSDAFSDGSSVFCRQCHGLVARNRWEAHSRHWCPGLDSNPDHMQIDSPQL